MSDGTRPELTDGNRKWHQSCSDSCAPHLHRHCSPECEIQCASCSVAPDGYGAGGDLPSMSREPDGTDDLIKDFAQHMQVMTPEQQERVANPEFRKVGEAPGCGHGTPRDWDCAWCLHGIEPPLRGQAGSDTTRH